MLPDAPFYSDVFDSLFYSIFLRHFDLFLLNNIRLAPYKHTNDGTHLIFFGIFGSSE